MKQALITKIETTYTPDGQGGYTEETIEKGSYDVKLSVSKDVNEATAYGVKCEQILKVIADEPLKDDEASLWLIIGPEGPQGVPGKDGAPDGHTPIKGTDYWTESDKAEIVQEAASSIPIATTEVAGKVKPDGTTITITEDGTISAVGGSGGGGTAADVSFDNSGTGLAATNVQSALVEINEDLVGSEEVQDMIDTNLTSYDRVNNPYYSLSIIRSTINSRLNNSLSVSSQTALTNALTEGNGNIDSNNVISFSLLSTQFGGKKIYLWNSESHTISQTYNTLTINSGDRFIKFNYDSYIYLTSSQFSADINRIFSDSYYANTNSGLTAATVWDAIDELAEKFNSLVDGNEVSY